MDVQFVQELFDALISYINSVVHHHHHHHHHHHLFNVRVPLRVGRTALMFVLSFFLHSILFAGSSLVSFQFLQSSFIVSPHIFLCLPRPWCPSTSGAVMLLIQPSFLATRPNQHNRLYLNNICMLLIPSFSRRESELMRSFRHTLLIHRTIAPSLRSSFSHLSLVRFWPSD